MGKQTKSKKPDWLGKGKVTPAMIAYIVDQYLSDNSYTETLTSFRSEASHLIPKSPAQETPKSVLSLAAILDDYITLKEKRVWLEKERCRFEQERRSFEQENLRVHNLLNGLQDVMNVYNTSANPSVTPSLPPPPGSIVSQADTAAVTPAGNYPMYQTPALASGPWPSHNPSHNQRDTTNFNTPVTSNAGTKRIRAKNVSACPPASKKSRSYTKSKDVGLAAKPSNNVTNLEDPLAVSAYKSCAPENTPSGSQIGGSTIVKRLFNSRTTSPPANNTTIPKTPQRASSSQTEKSISPLGTTNSTATSTKDFTPQPIMSGNCTIFASETIRVSPNKQIGFYSIEKNRYISTCSPVKTSLHRTSNLKDHVKGRLDFGTSDSPGIVEHQTPDGTSTSESEKEGDILGMDLDALGFDFNLSEFLSEFDFESDVHGLPSEQRHDSSPDSQYGSPSTSGNVEVDARQVTSQFSSSLTSFMGDTSMNMGDQDSVAAMQSVTKKYIILSPAKSQRGSLNKENLDA